MYRIKIEYTTGNSFGSYDETDYLPLEWLSREVAEENLQRVREHYEMYRDMEKRFSFSQKKKKEDWIEQSKNKPWFVKTPKDYFYDGAYLYSLNLVTDKGAPMRISAFWCGYFEFLNSASVESKETDRSYYKPE